VTADTTSIALDPRVEHKLAELARKIRLPHNYRRIVGQLLTEPERRQLRSRRAPDIILAWHRFKGGSQLRAVVELAQELDLLLPFDFRWLLKGIGEEANARPQGCIAIADSVEGGLHPEWDNRRLQLTLDGHLIAQLQKPNSNVARILTAFQEEGWPCQIDDPLPGGENTERLEEAVRYLRRAVHSTILFGSTRSGTAIRWRRA